MSQRCYRHQTHTALQVALCALLCIVMSACATLPWSVADPTHAVSPTTMPTPPFGYVTLFPLAPGVPAPNGLVAGPDGNLWLTAFDIEPYLDLPGGTPIHDAIVRMTTSGAFTSFPLPWPGVWPEGIVSGPDGNLWFTEFYGDAVGRITPQGAIADYLVPPRPHRWLGSLSGSQPHAIVVGPDGNLWFPDGGNNKVARITPSGKLTEYPIPSHPENPLGSGPDGIAVGPDGALWFTEQMGMRIGRITLDGHVTEFKLPGIGHIPGDIVVGGDGALWFLESNESLIGRITMTGQITEFPIPHPPCYMPGVVSVSSGDVCNVLSMNRGPDGLIWLSEPWRNALGRVDEQGHIAEFPLPPLPALYPPAIGSSASAPRRLRSATGGGPSALAPGPDGALWFTYDEGIGRFRI